MEPPESPRQSAQEKPPSRNASEVALGDQLKEVTRKERVYLLGLSAVGIAIAKTGLVPQEINTLGITFAQTDRQSLLDIFALVILYFLAAFVVYGVSDLLAFLNAYNAANWDDVANWDAEASSEASSAPRERRFGAYSLFLHLSQSRFVVFISPTVALIRAIFEFGLPLLVGFYAIWALLSA